MEAAGMTDDILQKLQDRATLLTAERKKRGKTIPEGLVTTDDIRSYRQQVCCKLPIPFNHLKALSVISPQVHAIGLLASALRLCCGAEFTW